ncbi:hypothetical protein VN24_23780 [Paenibacillus beijingensis]|uniref:Uncharacterized protein n=1 Tax=Paenibacillus beijingensis TaxID=1126833 RepID=A0A0D5NQ09_9BACL|nr:hypothetical protein VN24_23780 [Paenibacillus beijingensis]
MTLLIADMSAMSYNEVMKLKNFIFVWLFVYCKKKELLKENNSERKEGDDFNRARPVFVEAKCVREKFF